MRSRRKDRLPPGRIALLIVCAALVIFTLFRMSGYYTGRDGRQPGRTVSTRETVTVGDVAWGVLSMRRELTLGKQFGGANRAKGVFVLLEMRAERQSEAGAIDASGLALVDSRGRVFGRNRHAEDVADEAGLEPLLAERIQPRVVVTGWVVFDIPFGARGLRLRIRETARSGDFAYVRLL